MINNNFVLNISNLLISLIDVLAVLLPVLLAVAFMTIIERKQLASMQRRVGPNTVGYFGVLQPFAKNFYKQLKIKVTVLTQHPILSSLPSISIELMGRKAEGHREALIKIYL
jgi:NADH-ubiquinone oxidoreductase chain 1